MDNTILVFNGKGGVGKTPISFNIAYDLGLSIITNDKSALLGCYKDKTTLSHTLPYQKNTLYDCGGFAAPGILDIARQVDLVIVPVFNEPSALIQTKDTLKQILPIAKNVIVVATRTENKDFDIIKNSIDKHYPSLKFFNLPLIKAFTHSLKKGKSLKTLITTDKIQANWFGDFYISYYKPFFLYILMQLEISDFEDSICLTTK